MEKVIKGKAVVYAKDNIDTDQIYPGRYLNISEPREIAKHVLEGADISLKDRIKPGNVLVVGENFGCGSSREQAVLTLKEAGVSAVIASSFGRIWYRNAINLALPVLICSGFAINVSEGDELEVDLKEGVIKNIAKETTFQGQPLSQYVLNIFAKGGIREIMREKHMGK